MDFIYRLIPFLRWEDFTENRLAAIWVIALFLIFLGAIGYLIFHRRKIDKSLEILELPNSKKLKKIWSAYKNTFREYGSTSKTTEFAETYFHEQNILFASFDLRSMNNVSNILVGLGILGTFAGLTYGISDSSFETTEEIKSSIDNLLTGMGTAFVTSIWGMGLSLLYGFIFKLWQSKVSKKTQYLCLELDEKNKIKEYELEAFKLGEQKKLINQLFDEYLVSETEDGRQLPKNVFRQLLDESVKQTSTLHQLFDDLSESIEMAMQKLIVDNNDQISALIEDKLVPVLEDLKQIKQDSGTEVIENAVNRLSDAMKSMMDEFKNTIAGDTENEIETLTQRLVVVSESLVGIPKSMTDMTQGVTEIVEALKKTVVENINQSQTQAQAISEQNKQVFTAATTEYKSTVEGIQSHMEKLLDREKDNVKAVKELSENIKITLSENSLVNKQFETMIQNAKVVAQLIEDVSIKFNHNANTLTETSVNIKHTMSQFGYSINTYIDRNEELLNNHKLVLDKSKETVQNYSEKFEVIEQGLAGIFGQVQTGLREYQETTQDSLNKYLSGFATSLSKAHEGLESAVSGLREVNEELTEQIDKLMKIDEKEIYSNRRG